MMSLATRPLELSDLFKSSLTKAVVLDEICVHVGKRAQSVSMCVRVSEDTSIVGILIITVFIGHNIVLKALHVLFNLI